MNTTNKRVIDLSRDKMSQFYSLHNAFKSAEKQDARAKASWAFLCFTYKHLGNDMLTYFTEEMFEGSDVQKTVAAMVRMKHLTQPNL